MPDLFEQARQCIAAAEPDSKLELSRATRAAWLNRELLLDRSGTAASIGEPGRPARPELVHPSKVRQRKLTSETGRAAFLHALAHIEFNAINLACDAVYRFRDLPPAYYDDWTQVAAEEAYHFALLERRLRQLGYRYGDFPAHNGLWELAQRTAHDPLRRMALVPRMLEARGLDVTPGMITRLRAVGDLPTVAVLTRILREEVGHVAMGSRWFRYLCEERGQEPEQTYFDLLETFLNGGIRCPLQREARREAGFSDSELDRLEGLCKGS